MKGKRSAVQSGVQNKRKRPLTLGIEQTVPESERDGQQGVGFVNLYKDKPTGSVSLIQFERLAKDRKRVLQGIDEAQARGVQWKEMPQYMQKLLRAHMPEPRSAAEVEEARAIDHVSHFILRLAHSRTAELRKWFVRQEEVLLRYRFNNADEQVRRECLDGLQTIDEAEFAGLAPELRAVFHWRDVGKEKELFFKDAAEPWTYIYKVPFEQVADLVRYRKVLLRGGWAYMLSNDAASVVATAFRQRLTRALLVCWDHYHENVGNQEDERLAPLMLSLTERAVGVVYGKEATELPLAELPAAMQQSAPLCMRRSFAVLKAQHHMKHGGRMQLGLFVKGIGLSMENALVFWKTEFMLGGKTADEFDKQYTYNFMHQYGQAGSHTDYHPHACGKVIHASPDTSGATGCPFRNSKMQDLTIMLRNMKVGEDAVKKVVDLRQEQRYQLACCAVFEELHGKKVEVTAPHQYFAESRKHYEEKAAETNEGAEDTVDGFIQI
jgi:DNA primase large subunit